MVAHGSNSELAAVADPGFGLVAQPDSKRSESWRGWAGQGIADRDLRQPLLQTWLIGDIEHVGSTAIPGLAAKPIIRGGWRATPSGRRSALVRTARPSRAFASCLARCGRAGQGACPTGRDLDRAACRCRAAAEPGLTAPSSRPAARTRRPARAGGRPRGRLPRAQQAWCKPARLPPAWPGYAVTTSAWRAGGCGWSAGSVRDDLRRRAATPAPGPRSGHRDHALGGAEAGTGPRRGGVPARHHRLSRPVSSSPGRAIGGACGRGRRRRRTEQVERRARAGVAGRSRRGDPGSLTRSWSRRRPWR